MFINSPQAVDIAINAALDNGICVEGDQRQIKQVFWNMLVNAAHAVDGAGAISVTASVRRFSGGSDFAEVTVSDTGKGIDAKDMGRIFDPFYSTKDFGTGLGLAIAHRIVESHGGSIEVKSALGSGAVFTVTLPLADKPA
jgi:signal transduction histidine kinase